MCAVVVGGMERLRRQYELAAKRHGISLKVLNGTENDIAGQVATCELALIFTNKVSHKAKDRAVQVCKARNIPFRMVHGCGVSTLKRCLEER